MVDDRAFYRKNRAGRKQQPRVLDAISSNQELDHQGGDFHEGMTVMPYEVSHLLYAPPTDRESRRRQYRRRRPQAPIACMRLPPLLYPPDPFIPSTKASQWRPHQRRECNANGSASGSASEDDDEPVDSRRVDIRRARFRSLAAMSKLQHAAASLIQQEFRFYCRRRTNRRRRSLALEAKADAWLTSFLDAQVAHEIVPRCLLELLADKRQQAAKEAQRWQKWTRSLALELRDELLASEVARLTREAFASALAQLVAEYMAERAADRLSRAATAPSAAVAADLLADVTRELVQELLLQALEELTHELLERRAAAEGAWGALLFEELRSVAYEAIGDYTPE